MTKTDATKTSFTLSKDAKELLEKLSTKMGISQTAVLETLIRQKAKRELK